MTKKKIKDGDIIITCDKKPACYEHIARLEVLRKYRKLDKEHEAAVQQIEELEDQISDFVSDMTTCGFKYDDRPVADLDELQNSIEFLCEQFDKYKNLLNEVKEIAAKAQKDICNNCGWHNSDGCDPQDYTCGKFIEIQQKINEVIK